MSLKGKKILLAISGSISAYKMPNLVRLFIKAGAEVRVIMTPSATKFVTPLTLNVVSKNTVLTDMFTDTHDWNNHVHLALWADVILIAPMSANTLSHCAFGICNSLLDAVYLSARSPVFFAPAMDEDMWGHPAVQKNVDILKSRKNHFYIPVESGELASGLIGPGRLAEIEVIFKTIQDFFENKDIQRLPYEVLITAGPTYENIDPVRFIGNYSSGKMGIALAHTLSRRFQKVHLVLGPHVKYKAESANIEVYNVWSAAEMLKICEDIFPTTSLAIMSAAVADYKPKEIKSSKIKKEDVADMKIELVRNPDILATLGHKKKEKQIVVGFALETDHELENASKKLINKNADFIALNSLRNEYVGFGKDTNHIILLSNDEEPLDLGMDTKDNIAEKMINFIIEKKFNHLPS